MNNLPKRGPGRPKGSPNKVQQSAKDAIAKAAEELGGSERLVAWAQEDSKNEYAFWTQVYPKLLPHTINGDLGVKLTWPIAPPKIERT